ncbi:MAG: dTDP-3-amino-3,4,6-trideoxy-alpha-D-glucose transaminase [Syntrophomonadaceae bacterium]|nr:dTDP-3-amino-3,4,6-trideoxy-alpha-D-glucose transaminase [Bacillota bacterium]
MFIILYVVRSQRRDELQEYLAKNGIGTGIHYKNPAHLQEAVAGLGYKKGDFPETEKACSEILSLPMYPELKEEDQIYISEKIKDFFRN